MKKLKYIYWIEDKYDSSTVFEHTITMSKKKVLKELKKMNKKYHGLNKRRYKIMRMRKH